MRPAMAPVTPIPANPAKNDTEATTVGRTRAPSAPPPWPRPSESENPLARALVGSGGGPNLGTASRVGTADGSQRMAAQPVPGPWTAGRRRGTITARRNVIGDRASDRVA